MADTEQQDAWLSLSNSAFQASTSFIDNNYRRQWENNIRMHKSQHQIGSKYLSESYKYRSKLFRPKTRAMTRANEAATAAAFFTNADALNVEPVNRKNNVQKASAELRDGLLNHRLQNTIPWFLTCVGAMQDAQVQGVVASKQYWKLKNEEFVTRDENGETVTQLRRVKDEPAIELLPIEYIRLDPAASWIDPVNSSPYLIIQTPMYIHEVKWKIELGEFNEVDEKILAGARVNDYDSTRQTREGNRTDSQETRHDDELTDFDKVWVHENIIRHKGRELHYYTLGEIARLSEVKPLNEVYWHGLRPVVIGSAILETHNPMPAGPVEIGAMLQKEVNELVNTRQDNIKLVLNKRYIVRRGKQVDLRSLVRNVAGGITLAQDIDDVQAIEFQDVTASSYAEQDRLNLDYDELLGTFSNSSVQSNRKLNETVGGMQILRAGANSMTQFLISVFSETWVEKVLKQLDLLETHYETDIDLLNQIAEERGIKDKYGVSRVTPQLLQEPAKVVVNVTNSATDPIIRLEQFLLAVEKYTAIVATAPANMDLTEIRKEIFGRLGYKDGSRFFEDDGNNAEIQQMQAVIQQLTQAVEDQKAKAEAEQQGKMLIADLEHKNKERIETLKQQAEDERLERELQAKRDLEIELAERQIQADREKSNLDATTKIAIAKINDNTDRTKIISDQKKAETEAKAKESEKEKESKESEGKDTDASPIINVNIDSTTGKITKEVEVKRDKNGGIKGATITEKPDVKKAKEEK